MAVSIADAIRSAWASKKVEEMAAVADALRLQHGCNYAQVHAMFCEVLGRSISLAEFDEFMYAADEGFTGTLHRLKGSR